MRIVAIGDIHFGKKFGTYKPIDKLTEPLPVLWSKLSYDYILTTIKNLIGYDQIPDLIVFLGDIFDSPRIEPYHLNLFKRLLEDFNSLGLTSTTQTVLITGNHDTLKPTDFFSTPLSVFNNQHGIKVITEPQFIESLNILFLPYLKREQLSEELPRLSSIVKGSSPIILTHNDFYVNSEFFGNEMIEPDLVFNLFGDRTILVNGHIHSPYYEPSSGLLFTGSVSPTSFKDSPKASGICMFEVNENRNIIKFKSFANDKIEFISVTKKEYLPKLEQYLTKLLETRTKVILRYPYELESEIQKLIETFSSDVIIGVKVENMVDEPTPIVTQTQEIKRVQKLILDNHLDKNTLLQTFNSFMKDKYGIDPTKLQ